MSTTDPTHDDRRLPTWLLVAIVATAYGALVVGVVSLRSGVTTGDVVFAVATVPVFAVVAVFLTRGVGHRARRQRAALRQQGQDLEVLAERLRETESRLSLLLDTAIDGIFNMRYEPGNVRFGEARHFVAGEKLWGIPGPKLEELSFEEVVGSRVHPDDHGLLTQAAQASAETGGDIYGVELRFKMPDGNYRWLSCRGRTLEFVDGDPVDIMMAVTDVTRRRELEHRAAHADKMRSLGHLASGLSHDLNNLFAVIRLSVDVLQDPDRDVEHDAAILQRIDEMAGDGGALVHSLLSLAHTNHDDVTIVEFNELVDRVTDALDGLAGPDVTVETTLTSDVANVRIDRARAEQLVLNLGRNAIDAVESTGSVRFGTTLVAVSPDNDHGLAKGPYLQLTVADDGDGIPPEVADRIFEPFVTTKAQGIGTGLGLATAYDTVTHAGGSILATNGVDGGAVVTVLLPLSDQRPQVPAPDHVAPAPLGS